MGTPRGRTAWLSIDRGCANRGNLLIEHAVRGILGLERVAYEVSAFERLPDDALRVVDACDRLVLPGATLLDAAEHPAMLDLARLSCPKVGIGVAFCDYAEGSKLDVARNLTPPVGSRDSYTHERLLESGIESRRVGCGTLLLGNAAGWRTDRHGPIVVSLGRGLQEPLQRCVLECAALGPPVVVLEHVPALQPRFELPAGATRVEMCDALQALEVYAGASVVLTGRIHGLLACIARGIPVVFFGDYRDSRYSLLQDLGVEPLPSDPAVVSATVARMLDGASPPMEVLRRAGELRRLLLDFLEDWFP